MQGWRNLLKTAVVGLLCTAMSIGYSTAQTTDGGTAGNYRTPVSPAVFSGGSRGTEVVHAADSDAHLRPRQAGERESWQAHPSNAVVTPASAVSGQNLPGYPTAGDISSDSGTVVRAQTPTTPSEGASVDSAKHTPLAPPSEKMQGKTADQSGGGTLQTLVSVGSSLMLVLGLFFGVVWCYRKTLSSTPAGGLPKHVVKVLGRTPLAPRQQLVLVRFGSKLVLVSLVQGEARTISEITDPLEVDQLVGQCESAQPGSISQSFKQVLHAGARGADVRTTQGAAS